MTCLSPREIAKRAIEKVFRRHPADTCTCLHCAPKLADEILDAIQAAGIGLANQLEREYREERERMERERRERRPPCGHDWVCSVHPSLYGASETIFATCRKCGFVKCGIVNP